MIRLDGIQTRAEAQSQARALSAIAPTIQIFEGKGYGRKLIEEIAGATPMTVKGAPTLVAILKIALGNAVALDRDHPGGDCR